MKFLVRRTSQWADSIPPCDGLTKESFTRIDVRTFKSFEEFNRTLRQDFLARGENHRVLLGPRGGAQGIARDFPNDETGWFRDFDSLEDLVAFSDEFGSVIVSHHFMNSDIREIEIYDGYRE